MSPKSRVEEHVLVEWNGDQAKYLSKTTEILARILNRGLIQGQTNDSSLDSAVADEN